MKPTHTHINGRIILLFRNRGGDRRRDASERVQRSIPDDKKNLRNLPVDCNTMWYRAQFLESNRSPSKIIHTQRSLFFSHAHTRFVLCLRKGIYLWKRAISKTLRSAEWLKGAAWYSQKNLKNCRF